MEIRRKTLDSTIENQIVTASIVSEKFLQETYDLFNPLYMQNSFAKRICEWCYEYYSHYEKAPELHIKDLFDIERHKLPKDESENIAVFLDKLSTNYVNEGGINTEYFLENAMKYFRKRELDIRSSNIQKLLEFDRVEEAEDELRKYRKVAKITSGWYDPLDPKSIFEVFEEQDQGLFQMPGVLGEILGPFERDWFIAVAAPFKRGKSWMLMEFAIMALMHRLKVVFISLEMKKKNISERIYRRISALGRRGEESEILYPVFDCQLNQDNTCNKAERVNRIGLFNDGGEMLTEFDRQHPYRVCDVCRRIAPFDYRVATWFEVMRKEGFTYKNLKGELDGFAFMYGNNLRVKCYPRFMANVNDIKRDLDLLEQEEGFVPDVIIVDYADILKPEGRSEKSVEAIDVTWKTLASIAAERHVVLFTASQMTRSAIYRRTVLQDDLAEWIGKLAHVDIFLALNQLPPEKARRLMRVNMLAHRHKDFNESHVALLLQQLDVGQVNLDSEMIVEEWQDPAARDRR